MTLCELKSLLADYPDRYFRLRLPDASSVPMSFHITEVGRVQKTFLDCGGQLRERTTCQLQVWVGEDFEHRIETSRELMQTRCLPIDYSKTSLIHKKILN